MPATRNAHSKTARRPGPRSPVPGPPFPLGVRGPSLWARAEASLESSSASPTAQNSSAQRRRGDKSAKGPAPGGRRPRQAAGIQRRGEGLSYPSGNHVCKYAALFLVCPNCLGHPFRFRGVVMPSLPPTPLLLKVRKEKRAPIGWNPKGGRCVRRTDLHGPEPQRAAAQRAGRQGAAAAREARLRAAFSPSGGRPELGGESGPGGCELRAPAPEAEALVAQAPRVRRGPARARPSLAEVQVPRGIGRDARRRS